MKYGMRRFIYTIAALTVAMSLASCDSRTSTPVEFIGGADAPTSIVVANKNEDKSSETAMPETEIQVITESKETTPQSEDEQEDFEMAYNFDDMFKFNELNTYFDVHVAGLDGECFEYSIYFEGTADETRVEEISAAIDQWQSQYDEEDYLGYIDISLKEYHVFVYLDLGSIEDCDRSIYGIVEAIKDVQGIREVIVNESMEGMEDF